MKTNKQDKKEHVIHKLAPCLHGYTKYAIISIVTVLMEVVFEMYIPYIMADLINDGIPAAESGDFSILINKGIMMIVLALLSLIAGVICAYSASAASTGFAKNLRGKIFGKIESFSFSNMDKFTTASLITRLTNDVTNVTMAFQMLIRICFRAPVMLVLATVLAVRINGSLASIFIISLPVLAGGLFLIIKLVFPRFKVLLAKNDQMNAGVQETLIATRVVKTFVREEYEEKRFNEKADDLKNASVAAERILVINNPIMQIVFYGTIIAVCAIGGQQIIAGTMQSGDLVSFLSYIAQILMSVMMISMVLTSMVLTRASLSRIVEVVDEKVDITDDNADESLLVSDGSVRFDNVSFAYRADKSDSAQEGFEPVLCDINLEIKSGEVVGVIGGTGSAKTTLVQLIPRLYEATNGKVFVGGHEVSEYTMEHLRSAVSMVLQKNLLFSGTIADNLRWGNENATDAEIEEAAKTAQAHEFIMSFPDGYQTDLGQGGVNVSGGQKQRICIARALLKKPKILILDDSTSAVDTATDAKIREAFSTKLAHTTTIIVAQRLVSVMDADKIIVLDNGKVSAIGTHDTLLQSSKIYQEVYMTQMEKGSEA